MKACISSCESRVIPDGIMLMQVDSLLHSLIQSCYGTSSWRMSFLSMCLVTSKAHMRPLDEYFFRNLLQITQWFDNNVRKQVSGSSLKNTIARLQGHYPKKRLFSGAEISSSFVSDDLTTSLHVLTMSVFFFLDDSRLLKNRHAILKARQHHYFCPTLPWKSIKFEIVKSVC